MLSNKLMRAMNGTAKKVGHLVPVLEVCHLKGLFSHGSVRDIKHLSADQSNMPPRKCLEPCIFSIPEPLRSSFASHVIKQSTPIMNVGMLVVPGELVDIVEELIQALELNAEDELQAQAVAKQAEARGEATMNVSFWDDFEKNIDALTKVAREDRQADTRGAVTLFVRTTLSPIKEESKDLIINQFEQMSDVDLAFSVMDVNFSDDFGKNLPDILDARSATSEGQALPDVLDTFPDVLDLVVPGDVVDILEELIQALELNAEDVASSTSSPLLDTFPDVLDPVVPGEVVDIVEELIKLDPLLYAGHDVVEAYYRPAMSEGQALSDVLDTFPDVLDVVVPGDVVDIVEELIQALELNAEDVASSISTTFMDVGFWNNFEKNIDDLTKIAEGDRGEIQKDYNNTSSTTTPFMSVNFWADFENNIDSLTSSKRVTWSDQIEAVSHFEISPEEMSYKHSLLNMINNNGPAPWDPVISKSVSNLCARRLTVQVEQTLRRPFLKKGGNTSHVERIKAGRNSVRLGFKS